MKYEYFGVDRAACSDAPAISLCGEAAGVARWRLLQGRIQGFLLGTLVKGWEPCTMNQVEPGSVEEVVLAEAHYSNYDSN